MTWRGLMIAFQSKQYSPWSHERLVTYETDGPVTLTEDKLAFAIVEKRVRSPHDATSADGRTYKGIFGYENHSKYQRLDPGCRFQLQLVDSKAEFVRDLREEASKNDQSVERIGKVIEEVESAGEGARFLRGWYSMKGTNDGAGVVAMLLMA